MQTATRGSGRRARCSRFMRLTLSTLPNEAAFRHKNGYAEREHVRRSRDVELLVRYRRRSVKCNRPGADRPFRLALGSNERLCAALVGCFECAEHGCWQAAAVGHFVTVISRPCPHCR